MAPEAAASTIVPPHVLPRVEPMCVCMSAGSMISMCTIALPGCAIMGGRRFALTAVSRCRVIFESRYNPLGYYSARVSVVVGTCA